ncbi:CbiQ family ECF transporter T component [Propioniciclava flava]|uniref:ABC transporter permease n=1 Tax=Propioniciclava flava TaxID=2072026 RepID=A0A4Q2EE83_9ACTN|nr:CbiQ family ECF transporter T component [Propioniciclava flava]RXW31890.1 ABC transporter permease [Propioniciclava flava]
MTPVHPWAWWAWALGLAAALSMTTNPLQIVLIVLAVCAVVLLRRSDAPWARSLRIYAVLAAFIIAMRLFFFIVMGSGGGTTVLFTLPQIELPSWAAGIRLGGPVSAEGLVFTLYDAGRLAAMLLCLGAANALANPKRALRSVPAALYEASVAVVIALSVAPQLVESVQRVRRARRLRGGAARGWNAVTAVVIPVLADAIDRSLSLAAGMEARGFGRTRDQRPPSPALTGGLLAAMLAATLGAFLLLGSASPPLGGALLVLGVAGTVWGLRVGGRRLSVTRYRPDPWTARDSLLAASGCAAAATMALVGTGEWPTLYAAFHPATSPLTWPTLHPLMLVVAGLAVAPLALTRAPLPATTHPGHLGEAAA